MCDLPKTPYLVILCDLEASPRDPEVQACLWCVCVTSQFLCDCNVLHKTRLRYTQAWRRPQDLTDIDTQCFFGFRQL